MIKLPGPNDVPMMSQAEVDAEDPQKLAEKYYEVEGRKVLFETLTEAWHPDPKRETDRRFYLPGYCDLRDCLGCLSGSSSTPRDVQLALKQLVQQELLNAGWVVTDRGVNFPSVVIHHPKTPRPKPWYKKWLP